MNHTVEKIGGTSMSRFGEIMQNVIIADHTPADMYNRIFVVSAYSGITNLLLEDKKTGAPGVYGHFMAGSSEWREALARVREKMLDYTREFGFLGLNVKEADAFINGRLDDIKAFRCSTTAARSAPPTPRGSAPRPAPRSSGSATPARRRSARTNSCISGSRVG